jgi:ATP-dependent Clp protease ATP-binding subunit ClpC
MFNFDLQKTSIYKAVKFENSLLFILIKVFKFVFLGLALFFGIISVLSTLLIIGKGGEKFSLGFSMIFIAFFAIVFLIEAFSNYKLKNPVLPELNEMTNLAEFLDYQTAKALAKTIYFSKRKGIFPIAPTVFLYFLLRENPELNFILKRLLLNIETIKSKMEEYFFPKHFNDNLSEGIYSESFRDSILEALKLAQKKHHKKIEIGDMLVALTAREPITASFLLEADLRPEDVENVILWWEINQEKRKKEKRFWDYENLSKKSSLGSGWAAGYTLTLDKYSKEWQREVVFLSLKEIIGYQDEIEQVERVLSSPNINNVLLIGEPGVGMNNILKAVAIKSSQGLSSPQVNYRRVVELKLPQMLAQLKSVEEVEENLEKIFKEVKEAGNVILIINDFHNFVLRQAAPGTIDISGLIASYLELPQFPVIATTSYIGLHKRIEENPSILNLFSKVEVREPTAQQTLKVLQREVPELEIKYSRYISYPALEQIVYLSERFIANVPFPKKAIEVLEESMVYLSATKDQWLMPEHVHKLIAQKTEIPVGRVEQEEKQTLLNLEKLIHQRIINQEEAVFEVSTALRRARARLQERRGLIGGFLFLGPTGVGKTETSKALSEIYFGSEDKIIRLDMSEFQSQADIPRLLGSSGTEGLLTTPVRENPFSLVLLDEIEKAHPNILNLFLQVLDEGHITDGLGRKVDFSNSIVIATSNAGYKLILDALKQQEDLQDAKENILDYFFDKGIFRPEFINRFDAVVLFKPLNKENLLDICQLMLQKIVRGMQEKNIDFVITRELKESIVELGYDIRFGARNLKRTIQDKVENSLAEALLKDAIKKGDKITLTPKQFKVKIIKQFK